MSTLNQIVEAPEKVILHRAQNVLELRWPDGRISRHGCADLRRACACSGCTRERRRGVVREVGAEVSIEEINPMGVSALQFTFSDGHNRGLYPWRYLRELGEAE